MELAIAVCVWAGGGRRPEPLLLGPPASRAPDLVSVGSMLPPPVSDMSRLSRRICRICSLPIVCCMYLMKLEQQGIHVPRVEQAAGRIVQTEES